MPTGIALALGGGGSRGDFQVGAVQYLYEHLPQFDNILQPDILCGTSSGSILAAKLCEGEDPNNPNRGLKGLIGFWHALRHSSDMWNEEQWLAVLSADAKQDFWQLVGTLLFQPGAFDSLMTALEEAPTAKSLYNIQPVRNMLAGGGLNFAWMRDPPNSIDLRMTTVALESGALRYVDKFGKMWERDLSPVYGSSILADECLECASELRRLRALYMREEEALERGGAEADPLALSALANQVAAAEDALADCIAQHPVVPVQREVNLVDGVIASASIPTAFPPVLLGNEHYVDGGVRDNLPIDGAIRLGATKVYAVCSSAATVPVWRSVADGHLITDYDHGVNLLDITGRVSMDIMINEMTRQKTDPPNGWGAAQVIVIEPEFDLHDIMTIDAGLIRIAMGHGYMRADDVMQAYAANQTGYRTLADEYTMNRRTTTITKLRRAIWEREYVANHRRLVVDGFGRPAPAAAPDWTIPPAEVEAAQGDVRRLKRHLKTLLEQRVEAGGNLPPGSDEWWLDWEKHDWTPLGALWDANHPLVPLRHLQVAANLLIIPPGVPVGFLVTATEGGAAVTNAKVLVNGAQVGVTGTPFTHTFVGRTIQVYDDELKRWLPELVDDEITVRGDPWWEYFEEPVACIFDNTPTRHAQIELGSVPATVTAGQTISVTATVRNTGNVSWTAGAGYALGSQSPQDNSKWGKSRIPLPGPVALGTQVTFTFSVTAPTTPGSHAFQWQMLQEGVQWFGEPTPVRTITVVAPGRSAEFVSQLVSNSISPGQALPTTWKVVMKNTGTETWTTAAGYALGSQSPQDNTNWTKNRIPLPNSVAPGQTVTFKFTGCYAPTVENVYTFQWRMLKEGVEWFGPMTTARSVVVGEL